MPSSPCRETCFPWPRVPGPSRRLPAAAGPGPAGPLPESGGGDSESGGHGPPIWRATVARFGKRPGRKRPRENLAMSDDPGSDHHAIMIGSPGRMPGPGPGPSAKDGYYSFLRYKLCWTVGSSHRRMVAGEGKSLLGAGREEETRSMSRRRPNPLIASSTLVVLASTVAVCAVWGIRTQSVSVLEEEDDKEVKVRVVETPYAPPTAGPYPYPGFAAMPRPSTVIASYPKPDKVLLPESVALNTYSNYPYGPLPTSTLQPLAPQPPPNMPPFTPWGMMQPSMTQIKIGKSEGDDEGEITVNVPQQPDWVNFPAVQLDPGSAPFGSTPNTVDAFKLYTESIKPGTTFMPQATLRRNSLLFAKTVFR
eukprot:761145-Hanusia_phi.AAC.3